MHFQEKKRTGGGREAVGGGGGEVVMQGNGFPVSSNHFSRHAYASAIYLDCFISRFLFNQVSNFTYEKGKDNKSL